MANQMSIDEAIAECERWHNYLDRQRENTTTLQRAASLARYGDTEGALRLKYEVDAAKRATVYDGANLEKATKILITLAKERTQIE